MLKKDLINEAIKARKQAYVPYSSFAVGAAVRMKSGNTYRGCNIENASYPNTCCAERVAIFNALSAGEKEFKAIAVVADTDQPISPCGSCRQVMSEFFSLDTKIYLSNLKGKIRTVNILELLPFSFSQRDFM